MSTISSAITREHAASDAQARGLAAVRAWLFIVALFVFAMVLVGGATRLTGSGLSITEWQPILGVVPPTSEAAWQEAFAKYQKIPEYHLVNKGMSLAAFKAIYWWEWTHRLLGRLIGVVFFLPFVFFLWRRSIPRPYILSVAALFVLGGAQGVLGWFMVKSGLTERVDVSQYRLAAHLALAVAIAGYAFWLGLTIGGAEQSRTSAARRTVGAGTLAALVYLQIILGALVAGLKAGHASNTWPLMAGELIPPGLDVYSPLYLNLFENPLTAQFNHRLLAYVIAIFAGVSAIVIWRDRALRFLRASMAAVCAAILAQIALGVATIVYNVPLDLALAHQANAIVLFALALWHYRRTISPAHYAAESA
jgi:cytochrome c oxidase assembly protein subunit 15